MTVNELPFENELCRLQKNVDILLRCQQEMNKRLINTEQEIIKVLERLNEKQNLTATVELPE